jgi:hypothetical protein
VARASPDALRHLFLHQQHQTLIRGLDRAIESTHQSIQQRTCDVVRNVGHYFAGCNPVLQLQRQLQHIPLTQAEPRITGKAFPQAIH